MNKKIIAITFISLMLLSVWGSVPAQTILQNIQKNENTPIEKTSNDITDETAEEILSSFTIRDIIIQVKEYIDTKIPESPQKQQMITALTESTQEMQNLGITQETTLLHAKSKIGQLLFNRINTKYRPFLIGFFPALTTISTTTPSIEINITEIPTTMGNLAVKIEFFVKVIPFLDFITVREIRPLRHGLTQTTKIWPAVGARITVEGITVFIIAFGPRIKWTSGK
jgi:hypothetical protein